MREGCPFDHELTEREKLTFRLLEASRKFRPKDIAPEKAERGRFRPNEAEMMFYLHHHSGKYPDGLKASDLSALLQVTPSFVTQQVNQLEERGLLERLSDPDDRRTVRIRLTDAGISQIDHMHTNMLKTTVGLIEYLGEDETKTLIRLLEKAGDYLAEQRGTPPRGHPFGPIPANPRDSTTNNPDWEERKNRDYKE